MLKRKRRKNYTRLAEGKGKQVTGRFQTREDLENFVLVQFHLIWRPVPNIALDAEVNRMTVWRILGRYG